MAINFLNTVDLNSIQIENIVPENANAGTIGAGVLGQMYFDTAQDTMMQYVADSDGLGNPGYIEIGTTSGVETFSNTNVGSTYVDFSVVNASAIGDVNIGFADLNAVDGTSTAADRFLTKANKWATIPFGDITAVLAGTYINVDNSTGPEPTINHDLTTRTDTTSTASPASGATFTAIDSVTTNTTGHVTALNVKTVTLPPEIDTTYTLPVAAGASNTAQIVLTPSTGATNTVSFIGTTGRIAISETTGINGSIGIDFPTNVVTIGSLEVGTTLAVSGTGQSSFAGQVTIPQTPVADTDAASKKFVLDQVAGLGTFQGGYDASTDPGSPALTGASNIAFGQGDFYAVTTEGTITFSDSPTGDATLEVGDFIFSNTDITANSNPASTDFTLIIADQNIAEAGATDSATPKGISGFDSAMFTVTPAGWVQLDHQLNPYGRKILLNSALGYITRTVANGLTEFEIDVDDDAVFGYPGAGRVALAENVKVEVIDNSAPFQTVYADVTRSGSASLSIIFSGTIADSDYQALLTYV